MVLPLHCTLRVIEPAIFWRLQRDFLSLFLIEEFGHYIPLETSQKPFVESRMQSLAERFERGEKKATTTIIPKI